MQQRLLKSRRIDILIRRNGLVAMDREMRTEAVVHWTLIEVISTLIKTNRLLPQGIAPFSI